MAPIYDDTPREDAREEAAAARAFECLRRAAVAVLARADDVSPEHAAAAAPNDERLADELVGVAELIADLRATERRCWAALKARDEAGLAAAVERLARDRAEIIRTRDAAAAERARARALIADLVAARRPWTYEREGIVVTCAGAFCADWDLACPRCSDLMRRALAEGAELL